MTRNEARQLALEAINERSGSSHELVVLDDHTIERSYGWIFFYQTKRFIETGNFIYALGGNGPVVVEHSTGNVSLLGTGRPLEEILAEFERARGLTA